MDLKKIALIVGVIISLSTATGILFKLDGRWAKASLTETVKTLAMRLDIKILEDRLSALQERIWNLDDRYPILGTMPQEKKDEYRRLKRAMEKIEKQIEQLLK